MKRGFLAFIFLSATFCADLALAQSDDCSTGQFLIKYKGLEQPVITVFATDLQKRLFSQNPFVEYIEPNCRYHLAVIPSDSYYNNQWYLQKIKARQAWDKVRESPEVIIAIIDSGVDINNPDLKDSLWSNPKEIPGNRKDDDANGYIDDVNGWDFVNSVSDPRPKFQKGFTEEGIMHGTLVAGVAAATGNNAAGITGITWKAKLMALKVLDDKGEGSTLNVIKAVDYAIDNGANIINFSFVGTGYSQNLENAIKRAYQAGLIIVAAAGNESSDGSGYFLDKTPMYPVCHDGPNGQNWIIGVGATDTIDQKAVFSSYGAKCLDITAPGISIFSTTVYAPNIELDGQYFDKYYDGYWSGTSVASPMVAGTLALIESADPAQRSEDAVESLLNGADNIYALNSRYINQLGKGRLNAYNSVELSANRLKYRSSKLVVAPLTNREAQVKIIDEKGRAGASSTFLAMPGSVRSGISVASGDLDGDGSPEVITGSSAGQPPVVNVFDQRNRLVSQFFAFSKNFKGGINIASGDVNGDKKDEIIAGAGPGGGPHVRVFDKNGKILKQIFAFGASFKGGVSVAAGDMNADLTDEIIAGAGPGGGPHVRIFNFDGSLYKQFFAYAKNFKGGVRVAVGDIDGIYGRNHDEIAVSPWSKSISHIRIFDYKANVVSEFNAFSQKFKGGAEAAMADIDHDGLDEIAVAAGPGGAPHVRVFDPKGALLQSFYVYPESFNGGVSICTIKINTRSNTFR